MNPLILILGWLAFSLVVVILGALCLRAVNQRLPLPPAERERNRAILRAIEPTPRQGADYWTDFLCIIGGAILFTLYVATW